MQAFDRENNAYPFTHTWRYTIASCHYGSENGLTCHWGKECSVNFKLPSAYTASIMPTPLSNADLSGWPYTPYHMYNTLKVRFSS